MRKLQKGLEVWVRATVIEIDEETGNFVLRLAGLGYPMMTNVWAEADHFGKNVIAKDEEKDE